MYNLVIKRFFDFVFAFIGIVLSFPIFLVLLVILLVSNKGKPFFFQPRPGKNEKVFNIIKFKTMNDKKDASGKLLLDEERLTALGNVMRNLSLDEIPQLWNVLKGDMSFIGPRPLRVHYLPYYTEREKTRHSVRPGITGLAQVSGRNSLNWDERLAKDAEYVENLSFGLDVKIFFLTVKKLLHSDNEVYNAEMITFDDHRKRQNAQKNKSL